MFHLRHTSLFYVIDQDRRHGPFLLSRRCLSLLLLLLFYVYMFKPLIWMNVSVLYVISAEKTSIHKKKLKCVNITSF